MSQFMLQTVSLANDNKTRNPEDLPIAALLTNPKTSEILLTSHDTRNSTHHPLNHAIMNILNELPSLLPEDAVYGEDDEEQYYANMYDVYITHEPCTMCCMALVHSRIRRLIFWKGMQTGAKELGWMKGNDDGESLNHRYMCFEGIEGALGNDVQVGNFGDGLSA